MSAAVRPRPTHAHVERPVAAKREAARRLRRAASTRRRDPRGSRRGGRKAREHAVEIARSSRRANSTRSPKRASRSRASAIASGSRSRAEQPDLRARAREAPPRGRRPRRVASTKKPPRSGARISDDLLGEGPACVPASQRLPSPVSRLRSSTPTLDFSSRHQQLRQLVVVLGREVLARELRGERAAVGDDEVIDVPGHDDVGRQLRGVAQDLRDEDAPLPVERRVLAVVVDALEELVLRAVNRRQRRRAFPRARARSAADREGTSRPCRDVTNSSRPNASSICCRKRFGTLSRPFSSRRAGALPRKRSILPSRRPDRLIGTTFSHFFPD